MAATGSDAEKGPRLDLERALAQAAPEQAVPTASWRRGLGRGLWLGLLLSLLLHLLPLVLLIEWPSAPVEVPTTIPVQLVVEQPPPPPNRSPDPRTRGEAAAGTARLGGCRRARRTNRPPPRRNRRHRRNPSPADRPSRSPNPSCDKPRPFCRRNNSPRCWTARHWHCPSRRSNHCRRMPAAITPTGSERRDPVSRSVRRSGRGRRPARDEYLALLVTLVRPY